MLGPIIRWLVANQSRCALCWGGSLIPVFVRRKLKGSCPGRGYSYEKVFLLLYSHVVLSARGRVSVRGRRPRIWLCSRDQFCWPWLWWHCITTEKSWSGLTEKVHSIKPCRSWSGVFRHVILCSTGFRLGCALNWIAFGANQDLCVQSFVYCVTRHYYGLGTPRQHKACDMILTWERRVSKTFPSIHIRADLLTR